jgi:hypothetical protein
MDEYKYQNVTTIVTIPSTFPQQLKIPTYRVSKDILLGTFEPSNVRLPLIQLSDHNGGG